MEVAEDRESPGRSSPSLEKMKATRLATCFLLQRKIGAEGNRLAGILAMQRPFVTGPKDLPFNFSKTLKAQAITSTAQQLEKPQAGISTYTDANRKLHRVEVEGTQFRCPKLLSTACLIQRSPCPVYVQRGGQTKTYQHQARQNNSLSAIKGYYRQVPTQDLLDELEGS